MGIVLSAGIVPVYRDSGAIRILLLRAYRDWDFPKGRVEPHEDPLAAALRELAEETMITAVSFPWGRESRDTAPYAGGKVARYYLAEAPSTAVELPMSEELGRPEHHEFRWVSFPEARTLIRPRLIPILNWAEGIVTGQAPGADADASTLPPP